jgi:hypothetical protein
MQIKQADKEDRRRNYVTALVKYRAARKAYSVAEKIINERWEIGGGQNAYSAVKGAYRIAVSMLDAANDADKLAQSVLQKTISSKIVKKSNVAYRKMYHYQVGLFATSGY